MPQIELAYGRGKISFEDAGGRFRVLTPDDAAGERPLSDAEMGALIDDPLDSQPLEDILSPGESVAIVVSDATRATGSAPDGSTATPSTRSASASRPKSRRRS
jgi:nickel-dependent lactate racemase